MRGVGGLWGDGGCIKTVGQSEAVRLHKWLDARIFEFGLWLHLKADKAMPKLQLRQTWQRALGEVSRLPEGLEDAFAVPFRISSWSLPECGLWRHTLRHLDNKPPSYFQPFPIRPRISIHCLRWRNAACRNMLFSVPGGMSSLGCPATVTRPILSVCLN